jgi:hypothetical protein
MMNNCDICNCKESWPYTGFILIITSSHRLWAVKSALSVSFL